MTVTLAFYLARRRSWVDRLISASTGSIYSHVELLAPYIGPRRELALSISSSPRDGGVRVKKIDFALTRWSFVTLQPWHTPRPFERACCHIGAGYDWRAIAFAHGAALGVHNPARFTCSELIGAALGLSRAHRLSPGDLFDQVTALNAAYSKGCLTALEAPL